MFTVIYQYPCHRHQTTHFKLKQQNNMVKPDYQRAASLCGSITLVLSVDSLSQPVVCNSDAKISRQHWLNKSMVLINLLEAPLRSSRLSKQHSQVIPTGFGGNGGKGKA